MRTITAALLIILAQVPPQLPPRFRTGIDVVELDVTVLDHTRRPVRGLTAADFTLLEDDQPQDVIAFQEIDVPSRDPVGAAWLRDVAPDVTSNEPAGGRILIIVLDDATMPPNPMVVRTAKDIAREAITQLGPEDRAAVLFTRDNSGSQDFTADRARLTRAIDKLAFGFIRPGAARMQPSGRRPGPQAQAPASREDALWYHYSIQTVRRAAEYLRDAPHRRKTLLYISVGVPIDFAPGATEGTVSSPDGDVQRDLAYQAQRAFVEAVRSNVVIYGIDPAGLQVDDTRLTREFLQTISENTGGAPWSTRMRRPRKSRRSWTRAAPITYWGSSRRTRRLMGGSGPCRCGSTGRA
jgi:VWFA-related protein